MGDRVLLLAERPFLRVRLYLLERDKNFVTVVIFIGLQWPIIDQDRWETVDIRDFCRQKYSY